MSTRIADPEIKNEKLIQTIRTGVPAVEGLSKMRAMVALRRSRSTKKLEVFASVFADRREPPRFRHMAVGGLLELGGARAERALIDNARYADEFTAATLARALGRIGSPDSLPIVLELESKVKPVLRNQVQFAASMLAYRHNLGGHEVSVPTGNQLLNIESGAPVVSIRVTDARPSDSELATGALKRDPIGISLTPQGAQRIECDPNDFLLVWDNEFGGRRFARLKQRKGIAGVLFLKSRFEEDYCISALVLATPGERDVAISLHKPWGAVVSAGSLQFENESSAGLVLKSVRRPGAAAMQFSGSITNGRLKIEGAQSAATVLNRSVPKRDSGR